MDVRIGQEQKYKFHACLGNIFLDEVRYNSIHVPDVEKMLPSNIELFFVMLLQGKLERISLRAVSDGRGPTV